MGRICFPMGCRASGFNACLGVCNWFLVGVYDCAFLWVGLQFGVVIGG